MADNLVSISLPLTTWQMADTLIAAETRRAADHGDEARADQFASILKTTEKNVPFDDNDQWPTDQSIDVVQSLTQADWDLVLELVRSEIDDPAWDEQDQNDLAELITAIEPT